MSNDLVLRKVVTSCLPNSRTPTTPVWTDGASNCRGSRPSASSVRGSEGQDHDEGPPASFAAASDEVLSVGYGHVGPGRDQ